MYCVYIGTGQTKCSLKVNVVAPCGQRYPSLNLFLNTLWLHAHQIMVTYHLNGMLNG